MKRTIVLLAIALPFGPNLAAVGAQGDARGVPRATATEEGEDFPIPDPFALGTVQRSLRGEAAEDVRVNARALPGDLGSCHIQSETSVVGRGRHVWVAFNDGRDCLDQFAGSFTGLAHSNDGGKTFEDLGPIEPNGDLSFIGGDPVLALDTRGKDRGALYLASLAGHTSGASTLAVGRVSGKGEVVWHDVGIGGSGFLADKEWLVVDNSGSRSEGTLYLAWTQFGGDDAGIRFARSADGGQTWSEPLLIDGGQVQGARPAVGPKGEVYLVWVRLGTNELYWTRSLDGGKSFAEPQAAGPAPASGHTGVCLVPRPVLNGDIRTNEFPSVAIDNFPGRHRGTVYASFTAAGEGVDEADVYLITLPPRASKWTAPERINDDDTTTDQFFPEVVATGPGKIAVTWTDRREDATLPSPAGNRSMRQYVAFGREGGRSFTKNRPASETMFPPPYTNPNSGVLIASCYAGDYNSAYFDGKDVLTAWGDNRDDLIVEGAPVQVVPDPNAYFRRIPTR